MHKLFLRLTVLSLVALASFSAAWAGTDIFGAIGGGAGGFGGGGTGGGGANKNDGVVGMQDRRAAYLRSAVGAGARASTQPSYGYGGSDIREEDGSAQSGMIMGSKLNGQLYSEVPMLPLASINFPVASKAQENEMYKHCPPLTGYHLTDSADYINTAIANDVLLGKLSDPERWVHVSKATQQVQNTQMGNALAELTRNQANSAIDFCSSYLTNFTTSKQWNDVRDKLFVPMALLLLLPGAVLSQVKAIIAAGNPVIEETQPFEGILRSIVAIFLIPATCLVLNYGIDVANSLTFSVKSQYAKIFNGEDMYKSAICAEVRAFPVRQEAENRGEVDQPTTKMGQLIPEAKTTFAKVEGQLFSTKIEDPCAGLMIVPKDRVDEALPNSVIAARLAFNGINAALTCGWNALCAFQVVYMYYLWLMGPIVAALWVWPMKMFRDALPSWIEGCVTLCFWSLMWNTVILLMACFRGYDETGTIMMTAMNTLATLCAKSAFDFAGMVAGAAEQANALGKKLGDAVGQTGGAGGGGKAASSKGSAGGASHGSGGAAGAAGHSVVGVGSAGHSIGGGAGAAGIGGAGSHGAAGGSGSSGIGSIASGAMPHAGAGTMGGANNHMSTMAALAMDNHSKVNMSDVTLPPSLAGALGMSSNMQTMLGGLGDVADIGIGGMNVNLDLGLESIADVAAGGPPSIDGLNGGMPSAGGFNIDVNNIGGSLPPLSVPSAASAAGVAMAAAAAATHLNSSNLHTQLGSSILNDINHANMLAQSHQQFVGQFGGAGGQIGAQLGASAAAELGQSLQAQFAADLQNEIAQGMQGQIDAQAGAMDPISQIEARFGEVAQVGEGASEGAPGVGLPGQGSDGAAGAEGAQAAQAAAQAQAAQVAQAAHAQAVQAAHGQAVQAAQAHAAQIAQSHVMNAGDIVQSQLQAQIQAQHVQAIAQSLNEVNSAVQNHVGAQIDNGMSVTQAIANGGAQFNPVSVGGDVINNASGAPTAVGLGAPPPHQNVGAQYQVDNSATQHSPITTQFSFDMSQQGGTAQVAIDNSTQQAIPVAQADYSTNTSAVTSQFQADYSTQQSSMPTQYQVDYSSQQSAPTQYQADYSSQQTSQYAPTQYQADYSSQQASAGQANYTSQQSSAPTQYQVDYTAQAGSASQYQIDYASATGAGYPSGQTQYDYGSATVGDTVSASHYEIDYSSQLTPVSSQYSYDQPVQYQSPAQEFASQAAQGQPVQMQSVQYQAASAAEAVSSSANAIQQQLAAQTQGALASEVFLMGAGAAGAAAYVAKQSASPLKDELHSQVYERAKAAPSQSAKPMTGTTSRLGAALRGAGAPLARGKTSVAGTSSAMPPRVSKGPQPPQVTTRSDAMDIAANNTRNRYRQVKKMTDEEIQALENSAGDWFTGV